MEWDNKTGETPYEDIDGFKLIKQHPYPTRLLIDELEEENIRKATLKYLAAKPTEKRAPFSYEWLLQLHKEMYGDVWEWAGQTRTQNTSIGVDKHQIGEVLRILVADIQHITGHFDPIEAATRIHHRAVKTHPFKNGNGRWSRLLANIWLKQLGHGVTRWPGIVGEGSIRDEYLVAVKKADDLDYDPLIKLHKRFTKENPKPD